MTRKINEIELADGIKLEIKVQDKWFEDKEIKKAFRRIIAAINIPKTKSLLRFFFIHPSYFRTFEEFGLPLLFIPKISNYTKYKPQVTERIQISKEIAKIEISDFMNRIYPILIKAFIKPLSKWLKREIEITHESEEELQKQVLFKMIEKQEEVMRDFNIRKFIKKYVSPEVFSHALTLGKIVLNSISHDLVKRGLEHYGSLTQEISNNIELLEKITDIMIENDMITPLVTISLCMNKYCKHVETLISDRIPEAHCGKCKGDTLSLTFSFINEPYLWLKDKMLDLHALLYSYIESKSTQQYIDNKLITDIQCYLNTYIRNVTNQNEREIDAFLYSPITKKAVAIEIKIHEITSRLSHQRLQNILRKDLKQLTEILQQTGLKTGCYITNLKIHDEEIKKIKEKLIPKISVDKSEYHIELISFVDETTFLNKLNKLIENLKKQEP